MTELHLLCREYHFKGEADIGRWLPMGKVILRLRVDDSEWAYEKELVMDKINKCLIQLASLGVKYELLKVFRLPYFTISIQDVYENTSKLENT